jgi:hypothetical protein
MLSQKEHIHREAVRACEERAAVVRKAISKLIAYIEAHPENPVYLNPKLRRLETLSPLVPVEQPPLV